MGGLVGRRQGFSGGNRRIRGGVVVKTEADGMTYLTARDVRDLLNTLTDEELDLPAFTSDYESENPQINSIYIKSDKYQPYPHRHVLFSSSDIPYGPFEKIGGTVWSLVQQLYREKRKQLADAEDAKTKAYFDVEFEKEA
jgi:hypothetical protein